MPAKMLRITAIACLVYPIAAIALFSMSPSSSMDVFHRWPPSLQWWSRLVEDRTWIQALLTSLVVGIMSSTLSLILVLPVALRWRLTANRVEGKVLALAALSVCLPPIVLAVGLYQSLVRLSLFDTLAGLSLAHLSLTLPIAVLILTVGFRTTSSDLYSIARGLGACPVRAALTWLAATQVKTITACFGAGVLMSMSEVTITTYLTDTRVVTISKRVLSGVTRDIDPTGFAAMTVWLLSMFAVSATVASWRGGGRGKR